MAAVNLLVGWIAMLGGLVAGTAVGLFFHGDDWLGGYASWRRRMVRLGHVSLLGTGLLNLAFALSVDAARVTPFPRAASALLVLGAATMPVVCVLAAWRKPLRHLFAVPVLCLVGGAADFVVAAWAP